MDEEERDALELSADELLAMWERAKPARLRRHPRLITRFAIWWLGHKYGYPVWAGRTLLYEPDEPLEDIQRAWDEATEHFFTAPPEPITLNLKDWNLSTIVIRDNRFT